MAAGLLLDTDVLIDYLRAAPEAVAWLEGQTGRLCVSVISVAELYAGVREGREREELDAFVQIFEILPVDAVVAQRGGLLRREYGRSHGVGLPDALLAGTALVCSLELVTLNLKHFPMLPDLAVPFRKA
ncbi:MAG: type II toxin-antitoxin system VapC family toxin [Verrucomicrobiota bacterium]